MAGQIFQDEAVDGLSLRAQYGSDTDLAGAAGHRIIEQAEEAGGGEDQTEDSEGSADAGEEPLGSDGVADESFERGYVADSQLGSLASHHLRDGNGVEGGAHVEGEDSRRLHRHVGDRLGSIAETAEVGIGGEADDLVAHAIVAAELAAEDRVAAEILSGEGAIDDGRYGLIVVIAGRESRGR